MTRTDTFALTLMNSDSPLNVPPSKFFFRYIPEDQLSSAYRMATVARIIVTPLMFSLYFLVCGRRAYDFFLYQALYKTPAIARWQNIFLGTYTRISSPQVRNYRVIVMAYFFPFISEVETVTVITYESSNASKEIISIQCVEAICLDNT